MIPVGLRVAGEHLELFLLAATRLLDMVLEEPLALIPTTDARPKTDEKRLKSHQKKRFWTCFDALSGLDQELLGQLCSLGALQLLPKEPRLMAPAGSSLYVQA